MIRKTKPVRMKITTGRRIRKRRRRRRRRRGGNDDGKDYKDANGDKDVTRRQIRMVMGNADEQEGKCEHVHMAETDGNREVWSSSSSSSSSSS